MRNRDLLTVVLVLSAVRPTWAAEPPAPVTALIKSNCLGCHDAATRKGGLDLTALDVDLSKRANFDLWVKVHDRVADREMPPASRPQPSAANRTAMLKGLSGLLATADGQRQQDRGRVALRRLTRTEYENTMRDLFGMPGLAVKDLLPEDGQLSSIDKSSDALEISAVHLRKYLEVADTILDAAIVHQERPMVYRNRLRRIGGLSQFGESVFPINDGKVEVPFIKELKKMKLPDKLPFIEKMDSLGILTSARPSFEPGVGDFSPYHAGYYRLRTSLWSYHIKQGVISKTDRFQTFALTANNRLLAYFDAPPMQPREHEIVVWLNPGERLQLNAANLWPSYRWVPGYDGPAVAMDWFDVEGPLNDVWPPASHRRLFGNLPLAELSNERGRPTPRLPPPPVRHPGSRPHHSDGKEFQKNQPVWTVAAPRPSEDAERLLRDFLPRAFRRPVAAEELAFYVKLAQERLTAGDFFETAMRSAYRVALCSPDFLFLTELPRTGNPTDPLLLDGYAKASRLSYFLWNSLPDQELFNLAAKQQLGGKTLHDQVERMLADPRSERFVNDFLDQWLKLRDIDLTSPDTRLYPEFRPDLRDAMLAESRAYFREMLSKNLGAAHVIDSDFLMINQRLAEHYGIPGVEGGAIRRVPRPEGSPRGGFLTQAAVLKITANGTVTSPVLRGVWVLDRVLGRPPQPPPPDIAAIDPDLRGTTTIREQLDKHRSNATCATCHTKIDPPGFALECFDVIGGWRTRYRHMGEEGDFPDPKTFLNVPANTTLEMFRYGPPVDASGTTAQGQHYQDVVEFKRLLLASEDLVARNLVERLIHYATGAPVTFADRVHVDRILQAGSKDRYGLRTVIQQLVASPVFARK